MISSHAPLLIRVEFTLRASRGTIGDAFSCHDGFASIPTSRQPSNLVALDADLAA